MSQETNQDINEQDLIERLSRDAEDIKLRMVGLVGVDFRDEDTFNKRDRMVKPMTVSPHEKELRRLCRNSSMWAMKTRIDISSNAWEKTVIFEEMSRKIDEFLEYVFDYMEKIESLMVGYERNTKKLLQILAKEDGSVNLMNIDKSMRRDFLKMLLAHVLLDKDNDAKDIPLATVMARIKDEYKIPWESLYEEDMGQPLMAMGMGLNNVQTIYNINNLTKGRWKYESGILRRVEG